MLLILLKFPKLRDKSKGYDGTTKGQQQACKVLIFQTELVPNGGPSSQNYFDEMKLLFLKSKSI